MARALLNGLGVKALGILLLMALALTTSCLVTDPLDPRADPPPPTNHPPRIEEDSVRPVNWARIVPTRATSSGPADANCRVHLEVGVVSDDDITDVLTARWFVDYDSSAGAENFYRDGTILPGDTAARLGSDATKYDFEIKDGKVHVITLVVSDGFANLITDPAKPQNLKFITSVSWTIDASASSDCAPQGGGISP